MSKSINEIRVSIPNWLCVLDAENEVIAHIIEAVKKATKNVKVTDAVNPDKVFQGSPYFRTLEVTDTNHDKGVVTYDAVPQEDLYYKVLSDLTGEGVNGQGDLLAYVAKVANTKQDYDKVHDAMLQMDKTGYGVVLPSWDSLELDRPQLYHSGKNFGVKLKAAGASIHLVRVNVDCEVAPIIGEQNQTEEMLKVLQNEYDNSKQTVWNTPIFGRSLESIVREDIEQKAVSMPPLARNKMQKTLTKIVNNGKGGVICILL